MTLESCCPPPQSITRLFKIKQTPFQLTAYTAVVRGTGREEEVGGIFGKWNFFFYFCRYAQIDVALRCCEYSHEWS